MIDLRSDTVTKPTEAMRAVMAAAEVGDDVYGEDPTVNALQTRTADMLGMEAAIFTASGTQSNLMALLSHCQRGDEYIAGQDAHIYQFEGGGAAVLGGLQPQPVPLTLNGEIDLDALAGLIKPDNPHFARTKALCIESTYSGAVLSLDYLSRVRSFCDEHNLVLHLDGARVFNAAVALGVPVSEITQYVDSVAFCLSKGLGAPMGSMLCGTRGFIDRSLRWRKMLGGAMRQVGIAAAAGLYALDHNVERLADDHVNALRLAEGLSSIPALINKQRVNTNILFLEIDDDQAARLRNHFAADGITISGQRLVTHLDIGAADIEVVIASAQHFYESEGVA
jgi:threonine aldolase